MEDTQMDENGNYSEEDLEVPYEGSEDFYEDLKVFHENVLSDLQDDKAFIDKLEASLKDLMKAFQYTEYEFMGGGIFDVRWIFAKVSDGTNIIHLLIEEAHSSKLPMELASRFTEVLVRHNHNLLLQRAYSPEQSSMSATRGKNPLELASSYSNCMEIVKAMCEHGITMRVSKQQKEMIMKAPEITTKSNEALSSSEQGIWSHMFPFSSLFSRPNDIGAQSQVINNESSNRIATAPAVSRESGQDVRHYSTANDLEIDTSNSFIALPNGDYIFRRVFWTDLITDREDSCLHMAVRVRANACAKYLLERIRLTKETETVLKCRDHNGLTLLHLAVDIRKCKDEQQLELVALLISQYPDALAMKSGEMFFDTISANSDNQAQEATANRVKSAAPYKYFVESREQDAVGKLHRSGYKSSGFHKPRGRYNGPQNGASVSGRTVQVKPQGSQSLIKPENPVAEKMDNLLKLSCMRHFGRNRRILTELLKSQNQIHLDLNPRTRVTPRLLKYIAEKKLEQYLQYVYIPNLRVIEVKNEELEREGWWESPGRKDCAYIFDWLRKTVKVKKIIRVVVEDDPTDFHSDEVIEYSLKGFDIEEWKWFKWDLCIDTIYEAAPNVREVNLYWSGNRAVLKSWAALDGLASLRQLEKIFIMQAQSKESRARGNAILTRFKLDVKKSWEEKWNEVSPIPLLPEILIAPFTGRAHLAQSLSEKELEEKGKKDKWLECTENFGKMLKKWLNHQLSQKDATNQNIKLADDKQIRVAVIDDGVNIDSDDIADNVAEGETFYDNSGHWPGYYQSSYGHGHLMACLIRDLCPRVRLYIAKLNERWKDGRSWITPDSAAEAIEWARLKEVDIISMSWTIENVEELAKVRLDKAVREAHEAGILLFNACDDQGNMSGHSHPAKDNKGYMFKIGSATQLGIRHKTTTETLFDYIVPGLEEARHIPDSSTRTAPGKPLFGSSIATARCAGLAAMILQCIVLVYEPTVWGKSQVRTRDNMSKFFDHMVKKEDKNNYIRVWEVFEEAMNQSSTGKDLKGNIIKDLEGNIIKIVAAEFMKQLTWEQPVMTEPHVTAKS